MAITAETLQIQVDADGADTAAAELAAIKSSALDAKKGVAALGAGLALLAGGGMAASVKEASKFETAMADVQKVTDAKTAAKLEDEFKSLATEIPISQNELATLGEMAGKFGVQGSDNIAKFVETVGQISSATALSAEEAGTRFAKIAGAVGIPMSEIDKLGNATNALADSMKTDATEITDTATRASNVLSQRFGLSAEQVLGLSATMNEVSSSSRLAAGDLKRAAEALLDPKKAGDVANALGMTVGQFRTMRRQNPSKLLRLVSKEMAAGGDTARDLQKAVGTQATRAFSKLGGQLPQLDKALGTVNDQFQNGGSLAREMGIRTNTFAGQMTLAKNNIRNVAISIGDTLLPKLTGILKVINGVINWFAQFNTELNGLPALITLVTAGVGGLIAALGALASMGAVTGAISALGAAISFLATPITAVVGLFGTIGSAVASLTSPMALLSGLMGTAGTVVAALSAPLATTSAILSGIVPVVLSAATAIGTFVAAAATITGVVGIIAGLAYAFATNFGGIRTEAMRLLKLFQAQFGPVIANAVGVVKYILSDLASAFDLTGGSIQQTVSQIVTAVSQWLGGAIRSAATTINSVLTQIFYWWVTHRDQVIATIKSLISTAKMVIQQGMTAIKTIWNTVLRPLIQIAIQVFTGVVNVVRQNMPLIKQVISSVLLTVQSIWNNVLKPLLTIAWNVFMGVVNVVRQNMPLIKQIIQQGVTLIQQIWNQYLQPLITTAIQVFTHIVTFVQAKMPQIWRIIQKGVLLIQTIWNKHLKPLVQIITLIFNQVVAVVQWALPHIKNRIMTGVNIILAFWNRFGDEIVAVMTFAWDLIKVTVNTALDFIETVIDVALAVINGNWKKVWNEVAGFFDRTWKRISKFATKWINGLIKSIGGFIDSVIGFFTDLYNELIGGSIVPDMLNSIRDAFNQFITDVVSAVTGFVQDVIKFFTNLKDKAIQRATTLKDQAIQRFTQLKDQAIKKATQLKDQAIKRVETMKSNILGKFDEMKTKAVTKAGNLVDDVTSKLENLAGNALDAGKSMMTSFKNGIEDNVGKVTGAVDSVVSDVRKMLPGSDAKEGPLSDLTAAGQSLPLTFAGGMLREIQRVERAARTLASAAFPPGDRMRRQAMGTVDAGGSALRRAVRQAQMGGGDQYRNQRNRSQTIVFRRGAVQVSGSGDPEETANRVVDGVISRIPRNG